MAADQTLVVGYDGSETSNRALDYAIGRLGPGGRLFIVHAYELPPDFLGWPNYETLLHERQSHGREVLGALSGSHRLAGVDYVTELVGGPAALAIADVARVREADEIVVGSRGLGRVRVLLGSVSHELLHLADRPVVVIPAASV